jgi:glycosyltransferase involved in cell wall biosynthesis
MIQPYRAPPGISEDDEMTAPGGQVTVCLPVEDDLAGLRRCVPTVFAQTWTGPLELRVLADGSTDETLAVLDELRRRYASMTVIRNDVPRGLSAAYNQLLDTVSDGHVAWIRTNELWHPRKLELQFVALEESNALDDPDVLCTTSYDTCQLVNGRTRRHEPDRGRDQLRVLLEGEGSPPLGTLLGTAEAFRRTGGLDDRFTQLQDLEFLIRFMHAGGRLVSTPKTYALSIHLAGEDAPSPRELARAYRVIGTEHRAAYRRYGRRFLRERRSEQHAAVADAYAGTGHDAFAMLHRIRSRWLDPFEWVVRQPMTGRAVRLARRLRGGQPSTEPAAEDQTSRIEARGAPPARGTPPATPEDPRTWVQIASAQEEARDLGAAEATLRAGLQHVTDDSELRYALIRLLAKRRAWEACVEEWTELEARGTPVSSPQVHAAVARAHRALDDPRAALRVAAQGALIGRMPPSLENQLYRARASVVDWTTCLLAPPVGVEPIVPTTAEGAIHDLGFLLGGDGPVSGTVVPAGEQTAEVSLVLNGRAISTTGAAPPEAGADGAWTFSFSCHELLYFLGDGDVIEIEYGGEPITFERFGPRLIVLTGYPSRADRLVKRVRAGAVFTKFGKLRDGYTEEAKHEILDLFEAVSELVERQTGNPAHPFYGNLLGAVREHDFIGHDVGGFDMGYTSSLTEAEQVRDEFVSLCRRLAQERYHLTLTPWCAMIRRHADDLRFVDLNYAWFTPAGEYQMSYGWRYQPTTDREAFFSPRQTLLAGRLVPVPGNAEAVLEQAYGPNWVVPDQGFEPAVELQRSVEYLLTEEELRGLQDSGATPVVIEALIRPSGEVVSLL